MGVVEGVDGVDERVRESESERMSTARTECRRGQIGAKDGIEFDIVVSVEL